MAVSSASPVRLRRVLSFRTIVSTSTGLAYAAISLLACIQVASFVAGDSAWIRCSSLVASRCWLPCASPS